MSVMIANTKQLAANGLLAALCCAGLAALDAQTKPAWAAALGVTADDAAISSVSAGGDQKTAEHQALAQLTAYFKQSVSTSVSMRESESQVDGAATRSTSEASQTIEAVSALDALMGAQTEVWRDAPAKTFYARAVMDKAAGRRSYAAELDKALGEIARLLDDAGEVSFESAGRRARAVELAGRADDYALVLRMLDGPNRQAEVTAAAAGARAALEQARALPVEVRVAGDVNGRLKAAFAAVFAAAGYQTGGRGSRYALEASLTLSSSAGPKYRYANYVVDAALRDTRDNTTLFTYTVSGREGHLDQAQADARAVNAASQKVSSEFPEAFREFLGLE